MAKSVDVWNVISKNDTLCREVQSVQVGLRAGAPVAYTHVSLLIDLLFLGTLSFQRSF